MPQKGIEVMVGGGGGGGGEMVVRGVVEVGLVGDVLVAAIEVTIVMCRCLLPVSLSVILNSENLQPHLSLCAIQDLVYLVRPKCVCLLFHCSSCILIMQL